MSGEPYTPHYGAESRLHELVEADGMGALAGRTQELVDELGALGDPDSLWHYAQFDLLANGRPEEAEVVLDVYLRLYPESAKGYFLLSQAHNDLGQIDQALDDVRCSLEYDSDNERARSFEQQLSQQTSSSNSRQSGQV